MVTDPLFDSARQLLVWSAHVNSHAADSRQVEQLLGQGIDWKYLVPAAHVHGVMPLLWRNLERVAPGVIPDWVRAQLGASYLHNARRNLFLTGELLRLLELLDDAGISAIPFKGPALAASLYGDVALRQFCDLDLLVHPHAVADVRDLLLAHGFEPEYSLSGAQHDALLISRNEMPFRNPDRGFFLEVQWQITPKFFSFPLEMKGLWDRLQPVSLGGKTVRGLSPEDLLLILCVHGAKHLWERLSWIRDVAQLIGVHPDLAWDSVLERARSLGVERMLLLGLFLSKDLLGARLPNTLVEQIQGDTAVHALAAQVMRRLFPAEDQEPGMLATSWFHVRARERWQDKLRYCYGFAVTPNVWDLALLHLPAILAPLHVVLRPFRLTSKYTRQLFSRSRSA
ncbi:hypothetical protein BH23GEM5_BH23GEM5_15630 [soil metagenome]